MRYKYCPKCEDVRARNLAMGKRCESCLGDTIAIDVPRSIYGKAMYIVSGIAIAMIILYIAHRDYDAGFASFLGGVDEGIYIALLFGLIILAFGLAFIDTGRTNAAARKIIDERKGRVQE
ncbi:MAG: hypothetical protein ISF22_07650 [Methanomassiliicoccus sp.]|nr:hypothetical protein [Methanomassiliicoccus sp.]